jgi:predicted Zn-dependent protease
MRWIILFLSAVLCITNLFSQELSVVELENNIRKVEVQGNVAARSIISQYWQLADLYMNDKNYAKAYEIIIKGLQLDPWNYKYQKIAVDIEIMNKDYQKANSRLNFIINNLDELAAIYTDSIEIQSIIGVNNTNDDIINLPGYYVYIATFPGLNSDIVSLIAANISNVYGIEVKIINVGSDEYQNNIRDKQLDIYNNIVDDVRGKYSNEAILGFLTEIGLTQNDLQTREGKRIFSYHLLSSTETGRQQWQLIEMTQNQYSGNVLLDQLKRTFANYNNDPYCLGILGITKQDIYENDYNFLFGWAQKKWGVISYARFLLGDPAPTDEQFEKRTIIQSLSSVGFVIGIPRPTNPNCARAYPNSLAEMDRKSMELCDECKMNLRKLYSELN